MTKDEMRVGRWAELHESNPYVAGLVNRFTMDNPAYENALSNGHSVEGIPSVIRAYRKIGNIYQFPRGIAHEYGDRLKIVDETTRGKEVEIRSLITPREYQKDYIQKLYDRVTTPGVFGATGQASAGFGKTVCALQLVSLLGRKTLIMVHKEFLMTQWVERALGTREASRKLGIPIQALLKDGEDPADPMLDLDPDQVGIVQQDKFEWDRPLVIAMYQTLVAREYPDEFYESFGLVEIDETHRAAAPTFSDAIVKFPGATRVGVTATPNRKDGLEEIFFGHIGRICVVGQSPRKKPRVNQVKTPVVVTNEVRRRVMRNAYAPDLGTSVPKENLTQIVSYLVEHEPRNRQIVDQLCKAAQKGRKVLILSDRRAHLEVLKEMYEETCMARGILPSWAYYVGGMDLMERKQAERAQVLGATYHMAGEGLDIPSLDTLFLVTPRGKDLIEQYVGRILRLYDDKRDPVVVDFVDYGFKMTLRLAQNRLKEYYRQGWAA